MAFQEQVGGLSSSGVPQQYATSCGYSVLKVTDIMRSSELDSINAGFQLHA